MYGVLLGWGVGVFCGGVVIFFFFGGLFVRAVGGGVCSAALPRGEKKPSFLFLPPHR